MNLRLEEAADQTGSDGPGRGGYDLRGRAEEETALERRSSRWDNVGIIIIDCRTYQSVSAQITYTRYQVPDTWYWYNSWYRYAIADVPQVCIYVD